MDGVSQVPMTEKPSTVQQPSVSIADVSTSQVVTTTSSTTSLGGTSSILAQLSYVQPSIELLRRRRDADATTTSDSLAVGTSTSGPTHLLSSATQAALAALASTPRRYAVFSVYTLCTVILH